MRFYNTPNEILQGQAVAEAYEKGDLIGWNEEVALANLKLIGTDPNTPIYVGMPDDLINAAAGKKAFLYQLVRKALGQDTKNYPQQIGDCVSFGAKNATEYVTCTDIVMQGKREKFRSVFPPYYYGTGRVFIGGQRSRQDGSTGEWMAKAVMQYGTLFSDEEGVPNYAGSVAKEWGYSGPPKNFVDVGKKYLVKSAALIRNWADLVAAINNGYPCTVASNQGFAMSASSDGFHRAQGNWSHQMCIIGVDDEYSTPYALILNSWGDVFGHLKSFDGNEDLPLGVIRAKRDVIEHMIDAGETFAFSQFDGFPEQDLNEALFKVVGS
jgi:hypothetical protein